jgi:predicted Zn finger-like uncharacterized protein
MSLATRCPACATTFKVVKDQLRISDGWVRCGRCGEVFDATLDLRDAPPDTFSEPVAPPPSPATRAGRQPLQETDRGRAGEPTVDEPVRPSGRIEPAGARAGYLDTGPDTFPATTTPLFLDRANASAKDFWERTAVQRAMAALAFLGVVLLLGQMAHQSRDMIVTRAPSLRPVMTSMCKALGCEISALRQINDIKVDGASFTRARSGEGYRFSFTLRNMADVPLAMPAIELSLLDTQERAVVRRVLMPAEFGAPTELPARSERAASLALRFTGPDAASMPTVAGYRLETFYP